jgi:hypothetical protein
MDFLIVESGIKHHNLNPLILKSSGIFLLLKVALNTITLKRVKVMVFNATFNNKKIHEDLSIRGLRLWCLMPLSTIRKSLKI